MKLSIMDAIRMLSMDEEKIIKFILQKRNGTTKGGLIAPVVTNLIGFCDNNDLPQIQSVVSQIESLVN